MLRWQHECTAEWQKQYQDSWLPAHHALPNRVVVASCDYYFVGKPCSKLCRFLQYGTVRWSLLYLTDRTSARPAAARSLDGVWIGNEILMGHLP